MNLQATDYGSYTSPDDPGEPTTQVRRISVTDEEARLLAWLAHGLNVLEIGTGLGVSTLALACYAGRVVTIDIDPWVQENVWPTLPANVTGTNACFVGGTPYGLTFIDADHTTDAVKADIEFALSVVEQGGMIVCHDAKMDSVRDALDDTWIHVDTHHGLAIKIV